MPTNLSKYQYNYKFDFQAIQFIQLFKRKENAITKRTDLENKLKAKDLI